MPLLKHAIKKMRQDKVKTARNRLQREKLHDAVVAVEKGALAKAADLLELLKRAYKVIDKSAKNNLISERTGARRKSRLAKVAKTAATSK